MSGIKKLVCIDHNTTVAYAKPSLEAVAEKNVRKLGHGRCTLKWEEVGDPVPNADMIGVRIAQSQGESYPANVLSEL